MVAAQKAGDLHGEFIFLVNPFFHVIPSQNCRIAPAFAVAAVMLFTCGDRPIGARVFATVMLPVLLAALSALMLGPEIREGTPISEAANDLFDLGNVMKSGGVVGGLIAHVIMR